MLNSAEHEIFSAIKYENANYAQLCLAGKNLQLLVISNLRIISRTNFMLSWVEHEKSFITLGPGAWFNPFSPADQMGPAHLGLQIDGLSVTAFWANSADDK